MLEPGRRRMIGPHPFSFPMIQLLEPEEEQLACRRKQHDEQTARRNRNSIIHAKPHPQPPYQALAWSYR